MACNCKKGAELEDKYGVKAEESLLQKSYRGLWKLFILVISLAMAIVVVPVVIFVLIYNQIFRGGKGITMPKMLSKYLG